MNPEEHTDDCLDLYDDILVEDLTCQQESLHEVQIKYQEALRRIAILEKITKQNETDIVSLKKKNTYLLKNISVLYKTACTELERKKEVIESLRNQLASGFEYEYAENCRNRTPAYPYNNMFEPHKIKDPRFNENGLVPYNNAGWETQDQSLQFSDSHHYPSHSSHYLDSAITDTQNSTEGSHSPYSSSNMLNKEKSETHTSQSKPHNSHTDHVTESAPTDNHTPPARNKDIHKNTRDSSSRASHSRYADEHTPHTKQTDSSTSHSKHSSSRLSSRKHSGNKFVHSKRPRSKTPMSSHSNRRSSSTKRSHSDSRKHYAHNSRSHTSELRSSQSRSSDPKKSGHSSRIGSKDREPSSSSSSRSQHGQSHSSERGDTKSARSCRRSCSSDSKHQGSQSNKSGRNTSIKSYLDKGGNSHTSTKRKLPQEFSVSSSESKLKRKHKQKSSLREVSAKQSSKTEQHLTSCVGGGEEEEVEEEEGVEENSQEENSEFNTLLFGETDSQVNEEINEKENSDLHDLGYDNVHESVLTAGQDTPAELTGSPCPDGHTNITRQTATESQSLESMTREADDTTVTEQKSTSSACENGSQDSDVAGDNAEKGLNRCEELDTETNEPCDSVLWASKNLSDSDDETASEVDKLESASDTQSSSKKEEEEPQSDHSSDASDNKSDTSFDHKNQSIVIRCFGKDDDNSSSPIIIPCYPSKKSKSSSSASDSEEDCNAESHLTSTPSKSLIARSLFPLNETTYEESSKAGEGHVTPNIKAKQKIAPAFDDSNEDKDACSEKRILEQASDGSPLLSVPATQPSERCGNVEVDNNLDFVCSPILRKQTEGLAVTTEGVDTTIWQNGEVNETSGSRKGDYCSESSSENDDGENNNENCFHLSRPLDENNACADDELEEGEILTDDEENESVVTAALPTVTKATRSPARHKSLSRLECRKTSGKRYREECRKKPREPMKSDPHNRQRSSPDHFVSKAHCPLVSGKHSRYRDGRNRMPTRGWGSRPQFRQVGCGSGSRSWSRHVGSHHRQSGFHYKRSSNANGKRRTH